MGTTFHSLQVQSDQEQEETSHSGGSLKIQPGDFDQCEKDLRTRLFLLQPCRLMESLQTVVRVRMDQMEIINADIFILYLNIKIAKFM